MSQDSVVKAPVFNSLWLFLFQEAPLRLWETLLRFPSRLRERDFWIVQGGIALITAGHYGTEVSFAEQPYWALHHIPVILYVFPLAYASIKYSWEGGLLASSWVVLLTMPSVWLWHRDNLMWLAELIRIVIVVVVGVTLASRVEAEARMRRRAEAVSTRFAASEAKFRALFEAAGDAILVFDRRGLVTAANAAAASLFGAPDSDSLLGRHVSALVSSAEGHPLHPLVGSNDGVKRPARVTLKRIDGREVIAEVVVTTLPNGAGEEAFQAVLRDATAQETREKGLRSLVQQVTQAQEEERERIARELHDDTLQVLVLLSRELETAADAYQIPEALQDRLRKMAVLATSAAESLRRFSRDLRPSILNDLGLVAAIEWLAEDLTRRTSLGTSFRIEGSARRLPAHAELALFRIAQEALRNVEKHAHATRIEIVLAFESSRVAMTVADNGVGFVAPSSLDELALVGKLGLIGLKERASLVGGTLSVDSAPGQGTEVSVVIQA